VVRSRAQQGPALSRAALTGAVTSRASVIATGIVYGALLVFLRGTPAVKDDQGIFLSVIGRLLAGDRLYVDVFDNKDPLFFYTGAIAVWLVGWVGLSALDAIWLALGAISMAGLFRAIGAPRLLAAAAFLVYPLLLTGSWYYAGFSMLAALAFAPLVGWLWARDRWLEAGVALGLALGFKLNLALVLVAVPVALLVLDRPGSVRAALLRAAAGAAAVVGALAVVLAVRGELGGYLTMQVDNVGYSSHVLEYSGRRGGVLGHLEVVTRETHHTPRTVGLFLAAVAAAVWMLVRVVRSKDTVSATTLLAGMVLTTSAACFVTLALTAAWVHHLQMLAVPETFAAIYLAALVAPAVRRAGPRVVVLAGMLAVILWLFGAADTSSAPSGPRSTWWSDRDSPSAQALEAAADRRLPTAGHVTYARFGRDDDDGHGLFLDDRFELACPRFHQHLHTADYGAILRCIGRHRPQLVLVGSGFGYDPEAPARWNTFARESEALLRGAYVRVLRRPASPNAIEVWALRQGNA
jgi:hypothetical protein